MPGLRPLSIVHTEASDGWGGQEMRILKESLGMAARGHRVAVAAPPHSMINQRARRAGLRVFDADFSKKDPRSFLRMRATLREAEADVLNTHSSRDSWVAGLAARTLRRPPLVIRTRHLSTPIGNTPLSRLIYEGVTDAIMTTGEEIRRAMIEENRFSPAKIVSVPTGVDLSVFDPSTTEKTLETKGFSVGMVSVLRSWKGHEYFLRAVPIILGEVSDAFFYIAGEGPQRGNIERLITELSLGDRVFMLGHREDVPGVMKSLDVVVHPSYAGEGVPQSILQAFAMMRPVVAADAGAISEVVKDGETGLLIPPKDPAAIARGVAELYRSPALRARLAEGGRDLLRGKYSFSGMLDSIEALYGRLLREKRGNRDV
ncbi:MAG: glycosyltransferase family 4 protein [Thermodesulfovibrionales bacterium]